MGLHKGQTNSTSFKEGHKPWNKLGNEKYERTQRITINGKVVYLHRQVWESIFGKIPRGYVVHHIDGNTKNNNIENLKIMTQSEHLKLHHQKLKGELQNR